MFPEQLWLFDTGIIIINSLRKKNVKKKNQDQKKITVLKKVILCVCVWFGQWLYRQLF